MLLQGPPTLGRNPLRLPAHGRDPRRFQPWPAFSDPVHREWPVPTLEPAKLDAESLDTLVVSGESVPDIRPLDLSLAQQHCENLTGLTVVQGQPTFHNAPSLSFLDSQDSPFRHFTTSR